MTAICASFADFKLIKGRKVCQLVCEVPLEQADAALAALGGLPNPHAERWVGIAPLTEQPQGQPSPGPAGDGGSTAVDSRCPSPQAQPRGAAAAGHNRKWDDIPPSQQAGMKCKDPPFQKWASECRMRHFTRWDGKGCELMSFAKCTDQEWTQAIVTWYCGVSSRADLDTNPEAAARWRDLYGMFQTDTRYGGQR